MKSLVRNTLSIAVQTPVCQEREETRQACNNQLLQYTLWSGLWPTHPMVKKQPGGAQKLCMVSEKSRWEEYKADTLHKG